MTGQPGSERPVPHGGGTRRAAAAPCAGPAGRRLRCGRRGGRALDPCRAGGRRRGRRPARRPRGLRRRAGCGSAASRCVGPAGRRRCGGGGGAWRPRAAEQPAGSPDAESMSQDRTPTALLGDLLAAAAPRLPVRDADAPAAGAPRCRRRGDRRRARRPRRTADHGHRRGHRRAGRRPLVRPGVPAGRAAGARCRDGARRRDRGGPRRRVARAVRTPASRRRPRARGDLPGQLVGTSGGRQPWPRGTGLRAQRRGHACPPSSGDPAAGQGDPRGRSVPGRRGPRWARQPARHRVAGRSGCAATCGVRGPRSRADRAGPGCRGRGGPARG